MAKLLFLSGVALGDGVDAYADDVKDVAEPMASSLVRRGKAVPFDKKKAEKAEKAEKGKKGEKGEPKNSPGDGPGEPGDESDGGDA